MTELNTLRGKDSREAARVLAALSSSLLPQPGIAEASRTWLDSDVLKSVLAEIRYYLKVREDDFSVNTQSRIFAFVSQEISKAALANTSEKSVKDRLGNKGELRPSQYQVIITEEATKIVEALGSKKHHVIEALTHPDEQVHLQGSFTGDEKDVRPTISIKSVTSKRTDDDFILLAISLREGQIQQVKNAFRVYPSEVDVTDTSNPLDVLKAFVQTYGLRFQLGDIVSKYIEDEVIAISRTANHQLSKRKGVKPIEGPKGTYYYSVVASAETKVQAPDPDEIALRIVLAFAIDISKYSISMRRHKVQLLPEEHWKFPTI